MLLLPAFNAVLQPCSVGPEALRAHAQGHFCDSCQRVVQDFSQSANPVADLAIARAAAPDGRVCGSFRAAQVLAPPPPPALTQRLKRFLVALVLVVGQGLTAREALAQVRRTTSPMHPRTTKARLAEIPTVNETTTINGDISPLPVAGHARTGNEVYGYVEQMPSFRGGGNRELISYIEQQLKRPTGSGTWDVAGRVFVTFIVGKDGSVREVAVLKGIHQRFDVEVLRVVRALTGFTPGRQNGEAVPVTMTLPITFKLK